MHSQRYDVTVRVSLFAGSQADALMRIEERLTAERDTDLRDPDGLAVENVKLTREAKR